MIMEILHTGRDRPMTARQLADIFGCKPREITLMIEAERRGGAPICASCDASNPGYYLAKDTAELEQYCNRLKSRAIEVFKTRKALLQVMDQLPAAEEKGA